jgi:2-polyprenyl-3-methyl-5-hydroxy-6-metoxy-1,4-benzoquinol methylase
MSEGISEKGKSADACCKICGGTDLDVYAHTARCRSCKVLLFWPYPKSDDKLVSEGEGKIWTPEAALEWYSISSFLNHGNFTQMLRFTVDESFRNKKLDILDYGGGGGQFALVCRSHFPEATVYITDISDESLLDEWKPMNIQIPFAEFPDDKTKFDFVFMNDVFEHVSDPQFVLQQLASKLKTGGRIFIDTPKQFWVFPVMKAVSTSLYTKMLRGTVSESHLQIWSKNSFNLVVSDSGLQIAKYHETSEYTMPAYFYLRNMGITNPVMKFFGGLFYRNARYLAKNKIQCVLSEKRG